MKTVKVTTSNGIGHYLYHGGAFQSHVLYTNDKDDLKHRDFKRMQYSEDHLKNFEIPRIQKLDHGNKVELVEIELDESSKFVKEKDSK